MSNKNSDNTDDSVTNSLSHFIETARHQRVSDDIIYKLLKNQGWSTQDI